MADLVDDTAPAALRTVRNVPPDPARSRWDDYAGWTPPTTAETFTTPRHACSCARMNKDARSLLARFLYEAEIEIVPFVEVHYSVAIDAFLRIG